jgi:hypothetical protein
MGMVGALLVIALDRAAPAAQLLHETRIFCLGSVLVDLLSTQNLALIVYVLMNGVKDASRRCAVATPSLTPCINTARCLKQGRGL